MNGLIRFLTWIAVILGAAFAVVYYTYADVWTVPSDDPRLLVSIEPTLRGGDVMMVARHEPVAVGQLARCTDPDEPRRWVIARVAAMGGADISFDAQGFSTPGSRAIGVSACESRRLTNPATGDEIELGCRNEEFAGKEYQVLRGSVEMTIGDHRVTQKVPTGKVFLISDDRYLHLDSRDFGSLPETSCQHIVFRLWGEKGFSDGTRRFTLVW